MYRTCMLLPSLTSMIERMVLTKELNVKCFDDMIADTQLLEAVTSHNALTGYDYERLELLGICLF